MDKVQKKALIGLAIVAGVATLYFVYRKRIHCSRRKGTWDKKQKKCISALDTSTQNVIENLLFKTDSFKIDPTSFSYLDDLAVNLQNSPSANLKIEGHTDNTGSAEYNQTLSENRANEVKKYLVNKNISSNRIIAKGFGETRPITTNDTKEGRSTNRRVEFIIV